MTLPYLIKEKIMTPFYWMRKNHDPPSTKIITPMPVHMDSPLREVTEFMSWGRGSLFIHTPQLEA